MPSVEPFGFAGTFLALPSAAEDGVFVPSAAVRCLSAAPLTLCLESAVRSGPGVLDPDLTAGDLVLNMSGAADVSPKSEASESVLSSAKGSGALV